MRAGGGGALLPPAAGDGDGGERDPARGPVVDGAHPAPRLHGGNSGPGFLRPAHAAASRTQLRFKARGTGDGARVIRHDAAGPWADLPKVLDLARRRNAVIKVSGACTLSQQPYPFADIWDPLARVFDAWGFERCLWGTDWTRAFAVVNYEQAVAPFLDTDRLSDSERAMLMGGASPRPMAGRRTKVRVFHPPAGRWNGKRSSAHRFFCERAGPPWWIERIGIRRVSHAAASDPLTPVGNNAEGGHACHSRLAAKDYIFPASGKR